MHLERFKCEPQEPVASRPSMWVRKFAQNSLMDHHDEGNSIVLYDQISSVFHSVILQNILGSVLIGNLEVLLLLGY